MGLIYSIGILLYGFIVRIATLFNKKAKNFISGRKNWEDQLTSIRKSCKNPVVWIHSASLGEYEMARPIFQNLVDQNKDIIVSFYSPSGYLNYKKNPLVKGVIYLPLDTKANAKKWLSIIQAETAIFVKYDFWFNLINESHKQGVSLILVNGLFRSEHLFFKPYGNWFLEQLAKFKHLFLINEGSQHLLWKKGIENTSITGDLRYDRVAEICDNAPQNKILEEFKNDQNLLIGGSTWQPEEKFLRAVSDFFPEQKILIAPHDISKDHIKEIRQIFKGKKITTYSLAKGKKLDQYQVLIIDNIGMLASAYQYGNLAVIGGAFGKGLHNILEAATFGLPLYFGPNISKFPEASEMVEKGLAYTFTDSDVLIRAVDRMNRSEDEDYRNSLAQFMNEKQGAKQTIAATINHLITEQN